ncbi:MAG: hypothetical protein WB507_02265 [Solirubrobacterales bacterium]
MKRFRSKLSYANVMATVAVFIALGGAAYAATKLPKNSVGSRQIKKSAVSTPKIKNVAVTSEKLAAGSVGAAQLQANSVSGANVQAGSLGGSDINQSTLTAVRAANVTGISLSSKCEALTPLPSGVSASTAGDGCKLTFPTSVYDCSATATVALRTIALVFAGDRTVQTLRNPSALNVIETFPYENGTPASEPVDLTLVC